MSVCYRAMDGSSRETTLPPMAIVSQQRYDVEQDTVSLASFSDAAMQESLEASIPPQSPVNIDQENGAKVKTGE